MSIYKSIKEHVSLCSNLEIIKQGLHSKSQLYQWMREQPRERKERECKAVDPQIIEAAVDIIKMYPHFGAVKGQLYMTYHRIGYIPQHVYQETKMMVKRIISQDISGSNLLADRSNYIHETADGNGQIWAEDFTQVKVNGHKFYIAVIIDTFNRNYFGVTVRHRPGKELVAQPLEQAIKNNDGKGPSKFMLSDNGKQYIDSKHEKQLELFDIIRKRIPACKPQFNGSVECGIKEFKQVFYSLWAAYEAELHDADKKEKLIDHVSHVVQQTRVAMNQEIPRPCLGGVTPVDVLNQRADIVREENKQWVIQEKVRNERKEVNKKTMAEKSKWDIVKRKLSLETMSLVERLTLFCYFLKQPMRKITTLIPEVLGNLEPNLSDLS